MNAQHIKGLNVMSLKQSRKIASADKILYDPGEHRIKALTLGGPIGADAKVILFSDIKNIGSDGVMVESEDSIKTLTQAGKNIERMVKDNLYLINTSVMTEDGVGLGKIVDFQFDPTSGNVSEVEISQGPIMDVKEGRKKVAGDDIVRIGKNTTIVKGYIDEKLASEKKGGLQGIMRGMQEKITDTKKKINLPS